MATLQRDFYKLLERCQKAFEGKSKFRFKNKFTVLTPAKWQSLVSSLAYTNGTLKMPKQKVQYKLTMNDALTAMAMGIVFNRVQANFSRINTHPVGNLFKNRVIHQTFWQMDEKGTEATAASVVEINLISRGISGFQMRINRPYLLVIRERIHNTILFMGKISQPQWEDN